jgi:hypothetical protein
MSQQQIQQIITDQNLTESSSATSPVSFLNNDYIRAQTQQGKQTSSDAGTVLNQGSYTFNYEGQNGLVYRNGDDQGVIQLTSYGHNPETSYVTEYIFDHENAYLRGVISTYDIKINPNLPRPSNPINEEEDTRLNSVDANAIINFLANQDKK